MLPVAGRPLLAWTLEWLRQYGVTEAALNLHHLPEVVRTGLGDGSRFGMRLRYAVEEELRGTAGALHNFPGFFDQTFLVIYGDLLLDIDLDDLIRFHRQQVAIMTLALKRTDTPQSQGMIAIDAAGRVTRFVEKPAVWDGGDTANAGVYVCEPEVVDWTPPGFSDFGHDIIPAMLRASAPVYGRPLRGYLLDIGTPVAYAQAQQEWRERGEGMRREARGDEARGDEARGERG
jgi:NDP-sugar pyrophosphorylase family protein